MTNSNTTPNADQNKTPIQVPGTENKTPEQLALDKKNEQAKTTPAIEKKDDTSTEKKV